MTRRADGAAPQLAGIGPVFGRRDPDAEARRPDAHRRAQDQQRPRPGAAGAAHGQARVVAETGAGQHGVATATACALLGLDCVVYMGAEDMARQALNVLRMRLLGADGRRVDAGSRTLKDAINEAMRDWVAGWTRPTTCSGSASGRIPIR
jgi:hypothetical protein